LYQFYMWLLLVTTYGLVIKNKRIEISNTDKW